MDMTTAQVMAVEVLKGDIGAAMALADHLRHEGEGIYTLVDPIYDVITTDIASQNLRIVAYMKRDYKGFSRDHILTRAPIADWITEGGVLMMRYVDRLQVYCFDRPHSDARNTAVRNRNLRDPNRNQRRG